MARSINNGTGEIQIGTGGILEYPTNAYLRRSFYVPLSRAQLVALLVPRSTITRLRTDERVCATATVSTPFSPSTKPLFPRMKYVRRGRGPTASRDNSELCLSSSGNRPLFPTESRAFSPLLSFVNLRGVLSPLPCFGGHPFFPQHRSHAHRNDSSIRNVGRRLEECASSIFDPPPPSFSFILAHPSI